MDVGTDAKIARFVKRGIELIGLALIEASEMSPTGERIIPIITSPTNEEPTSVLSPSSTPTTTHPSSSTNQAATDPAGKSNFLTKLKRMSFKPAAAKAALASASLNVLNLNGGSSTTHNAEAGPSTLPQTAALSMFKSRDGEKALSGAAQSAALSNGTFGNGHGDESAASLYPNKHAAGYIWSFRKMLRRDLEGHEAGLQELTVEWRKSSRKRRAVKSPDDQPGESLRSPRRSRLSPSDSGLNALSPAESDAPLSSSPRASSFLNLPTTPELEQRPSRPSSIASASYFPSDHAREATDRTQQQQQQQQQQQRDAGRASSYADEDSGEDSDPEDSERPWRCDLFLPSLSSASTDGARPPRRRVHLGILKPAPHHPKLVAQLCVSMSLAAVPIGGQVDGLITAEEMKDLLSVTTLWLICRESLGGVNRSYSLLFMLPCLIKARAERRKGDRWLLL